MTSNAVTKGWTSGEPFVVTERDLRLRWNCGKPGEYLRCAFCGHKFQPGDIARWVYTNDAKGAGGNPFVCQTCDGPREALIAEILKRRAELQEGRWWWFV